MEKNNQYSIEEGYPLFDNSYFEIDAMIDLELSDNSPEYKQEVMTMLNQIMDDPSFIGSIDNPNIMKDLSKILDNSGQVDLLNQTSDNGRSLPNNSGREYPNDKFKEHYKDNDQRTVQHNPQMKNKRTGGGY